MQSGRATLSATFLRYQLRELLVANVDQEKLDAVKRELPGVHTFKSDVSDPEAIAALHDNVVAQFPALVRSLTMPGSCET
jgi:uncharacterized oxidoreductase